MTDAGSFLNKAIETVKQATEKDTAKDYETAFRLYETALQYFLAALKCTNHTIKINPHVRDMHVETRLCLSSFLL